MGNIITRLLFSQPSRIVFFFGLDAVEKISLLYLLKLGKSIEAIFQPVTLILRQFN